MQAVAREKVMQSSTMIGSRRLWEHALYSTAKREVGADEHSGISSNSANRRGENRARHESVYLLCALQLLDIDCTPDVSGAALANILLLDQGGSTSCVYLL
jgi:hypothetical protein